MNSPKPSAKTPDPAEVPPAPPPAPTQDEVAEEAKIVSEELITGLSTLQRHLTGALGSITNLMALYRATRRGRR